MINLCPLLMNLDQLLKSTRRREQSHNTMFSLIKKILSGFTNTTSTESSGEKEEKMYNIKTNVPEIDQENMALLTASTILEGIGNEPNPTANEFYAQLVVSDIPTDQ